MKACPFLNIGCLYILFSIGYSAAPIGKTLSLNVCGQYDSYQKWSYTNNQLSLQQYTDACLQCSGAGYCNPGMKPDITTCNQNDYTQSIKMVPVTGQSQVVNLQVVGLCLQSLGSNYDYASIQILKCNIGYATDSLQQFIYDSSTGYIKSNNNNTLCVTAMGYTYPNCSQSPLSSNPYCDESLDIDQRVNDLVTKMSIWEKIDNLAGSNIGVPRLGVPPNKVLECLHGVFAGCGATYNGNTGCPTSFPNALLLGATFNRTLWNKIGITISDEGRALDNQNIGGLYCFSPNINLFRDPRWGLFIFETIYIFVFIISINYILII